MKNKDPNYAIKVEQAIAKKYGEDTVKNPKASWDDEKEKQYLDQLKESYYVDQEQTTIRLRLMAFLFHQNYLS